MNATTMGIDLAKSVFQFHGVDVDGEIVFRKKLRRPAVPDFPRDLPPCLIGLEACATAHFAWAVRAGRDVSSADGCLSVTKSRRHLATAQSCEGDGK